MKSVLLKVFKCAIFAFLIGSLTVCNSQKKSYDESFVEVSRENPSYFSLSNGDTYIAIGLNLSYGRNMDEMERWFKLLSENGGNFARVWVGHSSFDYETVYGQVDQQQIAKVDKVLELAGKYGIKVKMCIENFRTIAPEGRGNNKRSYHVDNGGPFTDMTDYMTGDRGQKVFLDKVMFFKNRYGDDPRIFAWEIWNEMNAISIRNMDELLIPWNVAVLKKMQEIFPKNLVTQSMGSMDREWCFPHYEGTMRIPDNDLIQVHRYIDEGAPLPICQEPMDLLSADAIITMQAYGVHKPILLAESGAVRPNHTGAHLAYDTDSEGTILHDMLFAPYFTGAAGPGHAWHWDNYVERNNIWFQFRRFVNAVGSLDPIKEGFQPLRADRTGFRIYILKGKKNSLIWVRDAENTWQTELIDGIAPLLRSNVTLDLNSALKGGKVSKVEFYDPWSDQWSETKAATTVTLPNFKRSLILKIKH